MPIKFYLEAPIGGGKSSLLNLLKKNNKDIGIYMEPLDKWIFEGRNSLKDFYDDINEESSTNLQNVVIQSFFEREHQARLNEKKETVQVFERSFLSTKDIFVSTNMHLRNNIKKHLEKYCEIGHELFEKEGNFVYLKSNPDTLKHRIQLRNREEEKNIDFNYCSGLTRKMNIWVATKNMKTIVTDSSTLEESVEELKNYIHEQQKELQIRNTQ